MLRIVSLVLAFVVPPVSIWLLRGLSVGVWINLALCALAMGVFWVLFAGPGVALWALAGLQAVGVVIMGRSSRLAGEKT